MNAALEAVRKEESELCAEYEQWLKDQGLSATAGCAMELMHQDFITQDQHKWLWDFNERWDDWANRESDAMRVSA